MQLLSPYGDAAAWGVQCASVEDPDRSTIDDPLWDVFHGPQGFHALSCVLDVAAVVQVTAPSPDLVCQLRDSFTYHSAGNLRSVPTGYNMFKGGGLDMFAKLHLLALVEYQDPDGEDGFRLLV